MRCLASFARSTLLRLPSPALPRLPSPKQHLALRSIVGTMATDYKIVETKELASSRFLKFLDVHYTAPPDGKTRSWQYVARATTDPNGPGIDGKHSSCGNSRL